MLAPHWRSQSIIPSCIFVLSFIIDSLKRIVCSFLPGIKSGAYRSDEDAVKVQTRRTLPATNGSRLEMRSHCHLARQPVRSLFQLVELPHPGRRSSGSRGSDER